MTHDHDDARYLAFVARDARYDGQFFVAVKTTGIFCRPVCTVRKPLRRNVVFYPSAAAAFEAGFRPCLRCRPELAPDLARSLGAASYLQRAVRLIADGALDHGSLTALARRIGVTDRHLRRLFEQHLGASPIAVAQMRRLLFAKQLIEQSRLPLVDVAIAAGYGTVRRFNAAVQGAYARTPSALRSTASGVAAQRGARGDASLELQLAHVGPLAWEAMLGYLRGRAFAGLETMDAGIYRRAFVIGGRPGYVEVSPVRSGTALRLAVRTPAVEALGAIVAAVRRVFDLDANLPRIEADLARDPWLRPLLAGRPGLRVPGAWSAFEIAVRAILGQQVSVAAATTVAGRMVRAYGAPLAWEDEAPPGLTHAFPGPERLRDAPLESLGIVRSRAAAIRGLAGQVADEPAFFERLADLEEAVGRLSALPGIGAWTAHYIAMRGLGEPDAFPPRDLGLLRAYAQDGREARGLDAHAEHWRPWRAYAAMHLWHLPVPTNRSRT